MKWVDAIISVLKNNRSESGEYEPMHYVDITNAIIDGNLRDKFGKTPQNTVNANINMNPTLFTNLGLGLYGLTEEGIKYEIEIPHKPSVIEILPTIDDETEELVAEENEEITDAVFEEFKELFADEFNFTDSDDDDALFTDAE